MSVFKSILSFTLLVSVFILSGCSKGSDDPGPQLDGKTFKFTISVSGFNPDDTDHDYLSIGVVGGSAAPSNQTMWKVNGQVRANQSSISFSKAELKAGGPFVIESTRPLATTVGGIKSINFGNPFTVNFKAEVNGKVSTDLKQVVTDTFDRDYTY